MNPLLRSKINIDLTYRCTLKCPECLRQHLYKVPGKDLSVESYRKILDHFYQLEFCGNVSDPIFHPQFIPFLKMAENHRVLIWTAASHKPMSWYMQAFNVNLKARWIFGLDGFPEESHKYRINQDGKKLWEVMKAGALNGNDIEWQYIVFPYNKEHIEECREMATENHIRFSTRKARNVFFPKV